MNKKKNDPNGNPVGGARRVKKAGQTGPADWTSANGTRLAWTIAIVAANGGALRFGYTRDGGAYSVGVYGDGDKPYTDYIRPDEDIDAYLEALALAWGGD